MAYYHLTSIFDIWRPTDVNWRRSVAHLLKSHFPVFSFYHPIKVFNKFDIISDSRFDWQIKTGCILIINSLFIREFVKMQIVAAVVISVYGNFLVLGQTNCCQPKRKGEIQLNHWKNQLTYKVENQTKNHQTNPELKEVKKLFTVIYHVTFPPIHIFFTTYNTLKKDLIKNLIFV